MKSSISITYVHLWFEVCEYPDMDICHDCYKMDPRLYEWIMNHSSILKLFLEGEDESEFANYFSDKQRDLLDLDLIRQGAREPRLWHVCNFYRLEAYIPEFVDLYLNDLRNMHKWDIIEDIDRISVDMSHPDYKLANEWLIRLVQYDDRPYHYTANIGSAYRNKIFAMAYVWSMDLLTFALLDVEINDNLATFIYNTATRRGLQDVMKFAHENDADVDDGCNCAAESGNVECLRLAHELSGHVRHACDFAAESGNVECLRLAHELGGHVRHACNFAAESGNVECLRLAHELGGQIRDACIFAARNGHVECMRLAHELGGQIQDACIFAAENGHVECMRVAHDLGASLDDVCEEAIVYGQVECFRAALDMGARIGKSCEIAAEHGNAKCLEYACMAGGDIGRACEITIVNFHFDCFLIVQKYGGDITMAREIAMKHENIEVLEWLDQHIPTAA